MASITPITRKEYYLAYMTGEAVEVPQPVTREELYLAKLCGMNVQIPVPNTADELFLAKLCGANVTTPYPWTRLQIIWAHAISGDHLDMTPVSREEEYWINIALEKYETVTGNMATFTAKRAAPLKRLEVAIEPAQSGTGDPSPDNVRPISGCESLKLWQSGENLYHVETWTGIDGNNVIFNGFRSGSSAYKESRGDYLIAGVTYHFYIELKESKQFNISYARTGSTSTYSLMSNAKRQKWEGDFTPTISGYYGFWAYSSGGWSGWTLDDIHYGYEVGTSWSNSPPSEKTTVPITIPTPPGTVYGGTLDVLTGVLTVTHGNIASYAGETIGEPWISSMDVYAPGVTPTTGAQVVYPLAQPQTYQLTPTEVQTLVGVNNIWSGAGPVTVEYRSN